MHPFHPDNWPPAEPREPAGNPIKFHASTRGTTGQRLPPEAGHRRDGSQPQARPPAARGAGRAPSAPPPTPARQTPGPIVPAIATSWRAGKLTARLEHQTERAYLVLIELAGTVRKIWLPKSKVRQVGESAFIVPRWLARRERLTT